MKVAGIEFDVLGLGHGSGRHDWIQNVGHVITLGGWKLLHVGDADAASDIFEAFKLNEEEIDIAFLPSWFLVRRDEQNFVREHIKPKHIIAGHISPSEADATVGRIRQVFPNADAFTTTLENRTF